jgi:hypothetical protein
MSKKQNFALIVLALLLAVSAAQAEKSLKDAVKIGKANLGPLLAQMYLTPIEYDSLCAVPVHSRIFSRNDFYLLYFLKEKKFQAEMVVDKKTGSAEIISVGKVSPPYFATMNGDFNSKYFNADSITVDGTKRYHLKPDSVRLVYLGVTPLLGKRGVVWELFSTEGVQYISLGAMSTTPQQLYRDMNVSRQNAGNFTADSIRGAETLARIARLTVMTPDQMKLFNLTPRAVDSIKKALTASKDSIYMTRFPDLQGKLEPPKADSATQK